MRERAGTRRPPAWAQPGSRWGPRVYWPLLCVSVGLLVWRIVDGDSVARIAVSAVLVLAAIVLLVANHRNRRDEPGGREGSG